MLLLPDSDFVRNDCWTKKPIKFMNWKQISGCTRKTTECITSKTWNRFECLMNTQVIHPYADAVLLDENSGRCFYGKYDYSNTQETVDVVTCMINCKFLYKTS